MPRQLQIPPPPPPSSDIIDSKWTLMFYQLLLLVCISLLVSIIQGIFGSWRCRSHSKIIRFIILIAFAGVAHLVSYSMGILSIMWQIVDGSDESVQRLFNFTFNGFDGLVITMTMVIIIQCQDTTSAYALNDNDHWKRRKVMLLLSHCYAFWLLFTLIYSTGPDSLQFCIPSAKEFLKYQLPWSLILGGMLFISCFKMADTWNACRLACDTYGFNSNTKLIADYMYHHEQDDQNDHGFDPVTMKGYKYLVAGEDRAKVDRLRPPLYMRKFRVTDEVITIDKIWGCRGSLLTSPEDTASQLKDTCLSFSLYKLLRRRFAGYQLAEADRPHTLDFILQGLLSGDDEGERAFRVIEVELAFLYDSFYTKNALIFSRSFKMLAKSFLMIVLCSLVVILDIPDVDGDTPIITFFPFILVITILLLELRQMTCLVLSDWAKVFLICKYVEKPSLQRNSFYEKIFSFLCRPRGVRNVWMGMLGQYSFLDSYNYFPCKLRSCMEGLFMMDKTRRGQKSGGEIKLPKEINGAIAASLRVTGGKLSNGIWSLSQNGVSDNLLWACRLEARLEARMHTQTIFIWHIATELCRIERGAHPCSPDVIVADGLSRYCAYLVVFVPELLPDHKLATSCIFNDVVEEASEDPRLKGCNTMKQKYEKLMEVDFSGDGVMALGAKLGRQLINELEEEERWKVLAGFWAEMMLYLAPSDNAKAHAERLAMGGELITHLWALLTHAGILNRKNGIAPPPTNEFIIHATGDEVVSGSSPMSECSSSVDSVTGTEQMDENITIEDDSVDNDICADQCDTASSSFSSSDY